MHFRSFPMSTRLIQQLRPEKVTAGNDVLSGPITALTARRVVRIFGGRTSGYGGGLIGHVVGT